MQTLGKIALVVADYDEALDYFVGTLGFDQLEDTDMGGGKRWGWSHPVVVVAPCYWPRRKTTNSVRPSGSKPEAEYFCF